MSLAGRSQSASGEDAQDDQARAAGCMVPRPWCEAVGLQPFLTPIRMGRGSPGDPRGNKSKTNERSEEG